MSTRHEYTESNSKIAPLPQNFFEELSKLHPQKEGISNSPVDDEYGDDIFAIALAGQEIITANRSGGNVRGCTLQKT